MTIFAVQLQKITHQLNTIKNNTKHNHQSILLRIDS